MDNTLIELKDGLMGQIEYFHIINSVVKVRIQKFHVVPFEYKPNESYTVKLDHLYIVERKGETFDVPITEFKRKLIHIDISSQEEWVVIPRSLRDVK